MNKILIINKKNKNEGNYLKFYIGRPSALGNPYMIESWMGEGCGRIAAIREYRTYLREQIIEGSQQVCAELLRMHNALKEGDVALECWCAPMMCHGEVIKEYLETGKI